MKTYEKQKNRYQLCLLLFNNNFDLKSNKRRGLGRQWHRSPASVLTAISSHCLAALPAKMFEFSSHMRQNA